MRYTASDSSSLHMLIPRQFRALVTVVAATASICLAGHWEFEQVDSGSPGAYVAIDKMSDGTVWLAYVNRDSAIRLAHRDSAWLFEDIDTAMVRPMVVQHASWAPFSFDIGSGDVIGVTGLSRLAEHRISGWSSEELPALMYPRALAYDSAGQPSLTFDDSLWRGCFAVRTDPGWDTSVVFWDNSGAQLWFQSTRPVWRQHDNCAFMSDYNWDELMSCYDMFLFRRDSGQWRASDLLEGHEGGCKSLALLADNSDNLHAFFGASDNIGTNYLYCDQVRLDSFSNVGDACLDAAGRVQCAWVRSGCLKFAIPGRGTWTVQDTGNPVWCDITTDTLSQPVIAFCRDDGSIWVAHGVDVAGLSNGPQELVVDSPQRVASIVRGVLSLPIASSPKPQAASCLLDISGRKVLDLLPGTNDLSGLAPGIYFVREAQAQAQAVRKVVITR